MCRSLVRAAPARLVRHPGKACKFWKTSVLRACLFPLAASIGVLAAAPAAAQEATTYTYDALGRLTSAAVTTGPNRGVTSTYAYDRTGNRESLTVSGVQTPPASAPRIIVLPLNGYTLLHLR